MNPFPMVWDCRLQLTFRDRKDGTREARFVKFLVVGVDGPAFGSADELPEAHWAYMDRWADLLVVRGPTTTADGHHTGSVHVVELPDSAAAQRFADEEPFAAAGWYSTVTVAPVVPCTDGTMWDRPPAEPDRPSSFIVATFPEHRRSAVDLASWVRLRLDVTTRSRWVFCGVIGDGAGDAVGFVAMADEAPEDAEPQTSALLQAAGVVRPAIHPRHWRRGGRPA
jgi:uncharacterized protein YciI